jgi:transposase
MSSQTATFQEYTMGQLVLPMDFSDLIPDDHVARVIHSFVEAVDNDLFFAPYEGGGRPAYHPKMMTKIVLYAYTQKWYSCRQIACSLRENLPMMWLAARQEPNFRTINRFRSERMQDIITPLFTRLVELLLDEQYISMDTYFLDGTKIEANANRYSFVWRKSVEQHEARLQEKLTGLLAHIEATIEADASEIEEPPERVSPQKVREAAEAVEHEMHLAEAEWKEEPDRQVRKEKRAIFQNIRTIHRTLTRDYLPRLERYESQLATFGDRNSFSKTDPGATFMRMKEDHMENGQLKPGYNVQMGTENQFVLGYSVHQRPTDTRCLIPHLELLHSQPLPFPGQLVADAGYGSEPNYTYLLEEAPLQAEHPFLIPYNTLAVETKPSFTKRIDKIQNWDYDETNDWFLCPNSRRVTFRGYTSRTDPTTGYRRDFKRYESEDCSDCPIKASCTKAEGNRQVLWNPTYEEEKAKARAFLWSLEGAATYAKRKIEVESVFGQIKGNRSFRRFHLRGLEKVTLEVGLLAVAHNLLKVAGGRSAFRCFFFFFSFYRKKAAPDTSGTAFFVLQKDFLDSPVSSVKAPLQVLRRRAASGR